MRKALFLAVIAFLHVMPDASASAVQDSLAIQSIVVKGQREINTEAAVFVNYTTFEMPIVREGGHGAGREDKAPPPTEDNSDIKCSSDNPSTTMPVIIATGEKHKTEADFVSFGKYGLSLQRTYRSMRATGVMFGPNWLSSLEQPKETLIYSPGYVSPTHKF